MRRLFFLSTDNKKTDVKQIKKRRPCVLSNIFNVAFSVGLPAEINKSVRTSQVRLPQFRVTERFCVEGSYKRRSWGTLRFRIFIDRTFRALISSFFTFRKLINAFPFFPRNNVRGGLTSGLA